MAWIEFHDTLREHRKTYMLADCLRIPNAYVTGLLGCLWTWAINSAIDGNLTAFPPRAIAKAAGWEKKPETFVDALIECGWLDHDGDTLLIHDWDDYAGTLRDTQERNRKNARDRKRKQRDKERVSSTILCDGHEDVTRDKRDCHASTVPNRNLKEINNAYACEGDAEEVDEAVEGELPPGQQYRCFQEYNLLICPLGIGAMEMLNSFLDDGLEDDMICAVLEECNANDGRSIGYVQKALQGSLELGIKTLAQYQEHLSRWKERSFKGGRQSQAPPQREIIPMTPEEKQALEEVMRNGRRKVNNSS